MRLKGLHLEDNIYSTYTLPVLSSCPANSRAASLVRIVAQMRVSVTSPLMSSQPPIMYPEAPTERLIWWPFGRSSQNLTDSDMQDNVLEWGRELQSSDNAESREFMPQLDSFAM